MKNLPTSKEKIRQEEIEASSKSRNEAEVNSHDEFVKKVLESDKRGDLELIVDTKAFYDRYRKKK